MNTLFQPGQHPDAEQLSAFAEDALPALEHEQTLAHLAACAECRALVYLAQQAEPIEPAVLQAVASRRPRLLRWLTGWGLAVPAAALACLILLLLHLRNAVTPRNQSTATTTASMEQARPALPPAPMEPLVSSASPVGTIHKLPSAPAQKKPQPTASEREVDRAIDQATVRATAGTTAIAAAPAPLAAAPIAPVSTTQLAQLVPQMHRNGEIVLRAKAMGVSFAGGGVQGTVTDPGGAAVVKAQVTATNTETGVAISRPTTSMGSYSISPLPVGTYSIEVVAPGFQRLLQENVAVDNASMFGFNAKLNVGSKNETITVTDAPPSLDTTDATLGGKIENELYSELPLSMNGGPRSATAFQYLMPGVQEKPGNNTAQNSTAGASGIYGGTGQTGLNENYVEGVPASNINAQGNGSIVANAVTAVDQFSMGSGAARPALRKRLPTLPSKLPARMVVENASRTLAIDTAGALFRSDDAGVSWRAVPAQWQGRALSLRLAQPRSAAQPAAAKKTANTAEAGLQTQPLAPSAPAFELTTDSGTIYTSPDGQSWQRK